VSAVVSADGSLPGKAAANVSTAKSPLPMRPTCNGRQ
jgi:hypothetical protein